MVRCQACVYLAPQVNLIGDVCPHVIAGAPLERLIGPLVQLINPQLEVCADFDFPQLDQHAVIEVFWLKDFVIVGILVEFDEPSLHLDLTKINNDSIGLSLDYRALSEETLIEDKLGSPQEYVQVGLRFGLLLPLILLLLRKLLFLGKFPIYVFA